MSGGDEALSPVLERPPATAGHERVVLALVAALNAGRLAEATACFTRDACLITPGATAVHGRAEIGRLLAQMIAQGTRIEITQSAASQAGEVVLSRQRWTVRSGAAGGAGYTQDLEATLVLRRVESGWKLAIAAPWG
jgi:ketosteroid isomerase-like protein